MDSMGLEPVAPEEVGGGGVEGGSTAVGSEERTGMDFSRLEAALEQLGRERDGEQALTRREWRGRLRGVFEGAQPAKAVEWQHGGRSV